jgi:hypothetical protein
MRNIRAIGIALALAVADPASAAEGGFRIRRVIRLGGTSIR